MTLHEWHDRDEEGVVIYYRATIRVVGPRDTVRLVQTIFAR